MEFKSNTIKKTNKTNIVETVDGSDYLLTDKVYEVCEFLEKNGEWELSGNISDCWNPQMGIKNKSELLRTIGEYLKNNWDRRANTVTPIISKLRELYNTIENADFHQPMKSYNESKEMHLRYPSNNQKYFTPQQAEKMGYFRPEYVDGSKPYEQWFNAKGQRIYVQRIDPLSDLRKNTGKSGFRMHESKTNKNIAKISENTLRQIVAESVKKVLSEIAEAFIPMGYTYDRKFGGRELQISRNEDMVRFRTNDGNGNIGEPTEWLKIDYDKNGDAYADTSNGREFLKNYVPLQDRNFLSKWK